MEDIFMGLFSTASCQPCSTPASTTPKLLVDGVKLTNPLLASHLSRDPGATIQRMTYRFQVTVAEAFCHRTYVGFFSVDSPLTGVGRESIPVLELTFDFCSRTYTKADAVELPSVIFFNHTFLGLSFFTQDFSVVEGLDSEEEACFIYALTQREGSGDVLYFPVDVKKGRVAQVQD